MEVYFEEDEGPDRPDTLEEWRVSTATAALPSAALLCAALRRSPSRACVGPPPPLPLSRPCCIACRPAAMHPAGRCRRRLWGWALTRRARGWRKGRTRVTGAPLGPSTQTVSATAAAAAAADCRGSLLPACRECARLCACLELWGRSAAYRLPACWPADTGSDEFAASLRMRTAKQAGVTWVTPYDEQVRKRVLWWLSRKRSSGLASREQGAPARRGAGAHRCLVASPPHHAQAAFLQSDKVAATGNGSLW